MSSCILLLPNAYGSLVSTKQSAILPVACEILFSDAIEKCMQYLDAVPWTPIQEDKIRSLTSSLGITVLPHLAARLATNKYNSDSEHLDMVKTIL